ncbi:hypothetical protein ACFL60_03270 [Candidatus Omnitrophota bacterium]
MWKLLKAEFSYNKYSLFFVCLMIYGLVIVFSRSLPTITFLRFMDCCEANHFKLMHILFTAQFIFVVALLIAGNVSKRDRRHTLLPLSFREIGLSRLLGMLIIWVVLLMLYSLNHLIFNESPFTQFAVWGVLSLNGFVLILISLFHTAYDVQFYYIRKNNIFNIHNDIFFKILIAVFAYLFWFFSNTLYDMNSFIWEFVSTYTLLSRHVFFSLYGSVILNLAGIGMLYMNIVVFTRRRSYLS